MRRQDERIVGISPPDRCLGYPRRCHVDVLAIAQCFDRLASRVRRQQVEIAENPEPPLACMRGLAPQSFDQGDKPPRCRPGPRRVQIEPDRERSDARVAAVAVLAVPADQKRVPVNAATVSGRKSAGTVASPSVVTRTNGLSMVGNAAFTKASRSQVRSCLERVPSRTQTSRCAPR